MEGIGLSLRGRNIRISRRRPARRCPMFNRPPSLLTVFYVLSIAVVVATGYSLIQ